MKKRKPMTDLDKQRRKHLREQRKLAKALQLPLPPPFFDGLESKKGH